jgi:hypothetical protein
MQREPGIIYADVAKLALSGTIEATAASADESQAYAAYTESLVATLCERGDLDPRTAYDGVSLSLRRTEGPIGITRGEPSQRIFVLLDDIPNPARPGSYVARTERHVINAEATTRSRLRASHTSTQKTPRYQIDVGEIYGQVEGRRIGSHIKGALKDLEKDVPLLRIGVLRLGVYDPLVTLGTVLQDELDKGLVETLHQLLDKNGETTDRQVIQAHYGRVLRPSELKTYKREITRVLAAGIAVRGTTPSHYKRPDTIAESLPTQRPSEPSKDPIVPRPRKTRQTATELEKMIREGLGERQGGSGKPPQRSREIRKRR